MAKGVAQDDEANLSAAKAFMTHLIECVDPEEYDEVYGVVCSPSHVSFTDKSNLVATLKGSVNAIMVVTEPFATAYGIGEIMGSIVIDIGAGTTDIGRFAGSFPTDEDQVTIEEAGDWIDEKLKTLIEKKYTGAQLTKDMVRRWKEEHSYVDGDAKEILVDLSVDGKRQSVDIGDLIREACLMVVPKVANGVKQIIASADPEYQPVFRNNIIVSGGGSRSLASLTGSQLRSQTSVMSVSGASKIRLRGWPSEPSPWLATCPMRCTRPSTDRVIHRIGSSTRVQRERLKGGRAANQSHGSSLHVSIWDREQFRCLG